MSTRAMIGIKMLAGGVRATCLHNDGHVMHTGYTLAIFYGSEAKFRALLELGDLSAIGERLAPESKEAHSFVAPAEGVTVAYHRDRGEALRPAREYASPEAYLAALKEFAASYLYLFDSGRLLVASSTTAEFIEIKFTTGK